MNRRVPLSVRCIAPAFRSLRLYLRCSRVFGINSRCLAIALSRIEFMILYQTCTSYLTRIRQR